MGNGGMRVRYSVLLGAKTREMSLLMPNPQVGARRARRYSPFATSTDMTTDLKPQAQRALRAPAEARPEEQDPATLTTPDEIFDRATVRRAEFDLDYAGAVSPREAWTLFRERAALLVDVRTAPEFKFVGRVPGAINIEWHGADTGPRTAFVQALRRVAPANEPVLLLCRSGVRSHAAAEAAANAGYARVYNVLEGFEGQIDNSSRRGRINGWRFHDLPWVQD